MDLLDYLAELDAPAPGTLDPGPCPMEYTEDPYTVAEYEQARAAWEDAHRGEPLHYTGWRVPMWAQRTPRLDGHQVVILEAWRTRDFGDWVYRAVDEACGWQSMPDGHEAVVAAWHDHVWPGWRDLPVIRTQHREGPKHLRAYVDAQPPEWQRRGAPTITYREAPSNRPVPQRNPWWGWDLAHTILDVRPAGVSQEGVTT